MKKRETRISKRAEASIEEDDLASQAYWYLLRQHHQLSWCTLYEIALAIGVDAEGNPHHKEIAPHRYHCLSCVRPLTAALTRFDGFGRHFDLRCNFAGTDDAVRLRADITKTLSSPPALTWAERVYSIVIAAGCHSDELGLDLVDLVAAPVLVKPRSLALPPDQDEATLMRGILQEDPRFDVRWNNQKDKMDVKADAELLARDSQRHSVLEKPGNLLGRSHFSDEWAVFVRALPQFRYFLYSFNVMRSCAIDHTIVKIVSSTTITLYEY